MQHFKHHQIDKKKWDTCISSSKENIIYAFSWYLDCVCPFWEGFILEDNEQNYLAVMPLPVKKKYGISFLQVPLFAQQLGVFSTKKLSNLEFKASLVLLQKKFQLVSNYPFNTTNYEDFKTEFEEVFDKSNLKNFKTHHLSLNQNYLKTRQNYKKDTKYRINQAQKQNFETLKGNDIDLVWQFFESTIFLENGISKQSEPTLKSLFKILKEKGLAELYYIQKKNNEGKREILSGILLIKSESFYQTNNQNHSIIKWIYLFNAAKSKDESRRWFLDKFIQEKSKQEKDVIQLLDFESAQEKEVARFYASFGSEEKLFFVVDYNALSFHVKIAQWIIRTIRQFINK